MNQAWIRYLPDFIRTRVEGRHNLQKVINNAGWLFADKIVRMGIGLVVGVQVARYLGPEQFGQFNYAIAFVGLYGAIASVGLNSMVVRDIVREPEATNTTLGTAFVLQVFGSLVAIALIVGTLAWLRPGDTFTKSMVAILGLIYFFKSADVVKYWFESQVQSLYAVWIENGAFIIMAGVKVAMILQQAPLMAFVWVTFAEAVLVAVGLLAIYAKQGGHLRAWKPSFARAKRLIKDCWPLIFSGIAVSMYLRIDQIMLAEIIGNRVVGIYSAAVQISEIWFFIPTTIVASIFPSIINAKMISESLYKEHLQNLYDLMVILALAIAIPMTFLSDMVVVWLYGRSYSEAGSVLSINIWAGVFVFLGTACGIYTNSENLARYSLFQTSIGLLINVVLNILLIPKWGAKGAAIATVISYAFATFAVLLFSRTRRNGLSMLRSLLVIRKCYRFRIVERLISVVSRQFESFFKARFEDKYRTAGFRFVYTNKFDICTYVHPEKLFDIIETNSSCDAEPMLEALSTKISNAGVVLDVGANIGIVSIWLSKRANVVYSFEPDTSNVEFMKQNLKLNSASNVIICELAVGKQSGKADFYIREAFGHHGLQSKHISKVAQIKTVVVVTLDEFCANNAIQEVSLLKLDIEGGELDALMGFKSFLASKKVKMIIFEHAPVLSGNDRYSRLAVFNYLTGFGYSIYNLDHHAMSQDEMADASQGDFYAII